MFIIIFYFCIIINYCPLHYIFDPLLVFSLLLHSTVDQESFVATHNNKMYTFNYHCKDGQRKYSNAEDFLIDAVFSFFRYTV